MYIMRMLLRKMFPPIPVLILPILTNCEITILQISTCLIFDGFFNVTSSNLRKIKTKEKQIEKLAQIAVIQRILFFFFFFFPFVSFFPVCFSNRQDRLSLLAMQGFYFWNRYISSPDVVVGLYHKISNQRLLESYSDLWN